MSGTFAARVTTQHHHRQREPDRDRRTALQDERRQAEHRPAQDHQQEQRIHDADAERGVAAVEHCREQVGQEAGDGLGHVLHVRVDRDLRAVDLAPGGRGNLGGGLGERQQPGPGQLVDLPRPARTRPCQVRERAGEARQ
ncbi:hypothetical protein AB0K40_45370 [Nonomuraea bangladeshensis]|uniref:Uncharacterized protein n=1 Tax=Nonomuraea bangladeshensis TaxID=404385 RepID=A0ABV3HKF3_9ACTN